MFAGLPLMAVQIALLEWFRAASSPSDRAATLVNRDPLVTCRTLMVLAGGASSRKLDLDAFIRQAGEYEDWSSGWDKLNRLRTELFLTHSYPVRRVKEITAWVHSGEYDRIAGGEYPDARPAGRRAQGGRRRGRVLQGALPQDLQRVRRRARRRSRSPTRPASSATGSRPTAAGNDAE